MVIQSEEILAGVQNRFYLPGISVLLSILATAYLAHYNVPRLDPSKRASKAPLYYEQLAPDPKTGKKETHQ